MKSTVELLIKTAAAALLLVQTTLLAAGESSPYLSPAAMAATKDGKALYIACATGQKSLQFDLATRKVIASLDLPAPASGLALSADQKQLFITCASPQGKVLIVDLAANKIVDQIAVGHTPTSPVLSPDGKTLFVCNRYNNDVSVINLKAKKQVRRIAVERQPVSAAITPDGRFLLVANLLQSAKSDQDYVAASVSVIDVAAGKVSKTLQLANGSGSLHEIQISPDGKYAAVAHVLARFHLPASMVDRGWMNANAVTLIDLGRMEIINTFLLDSPDSGAANPWGLAWSADGAKLIVAHSGSHELSLINFPALLAKLATLPASSEHADAASYGGAVPQAQADASHDLSFLLGLRERLKLPSQDIGPRAVTVVGNRAWAADYFSDTLSTVDAAAERPAVESIALGPKTEPDIVRKGEMYFHDGRICFQTWQSCSSCHPGDARTDAMNWDLLNDGVGNPKNNKSLLLAHRTPPTMSLGIRETAETAVRSGIRFVLFSQQPEDVACAIDEYLKALKPVPSPLLVDGKFSEKAKRGEKIFSQAGCASCHPAGLFTDLQSYDVGTQAKTDKPADKFDTPTLVEIWRTAPYLHDGSAVTLREVVTEHNPQDRHGKTSSLTTKQIDDLCEYLLSL